MLLVLSPASCSERGEAGSDPDGDADDGDREGQRSGNAREKMDSKINMVGDGYSQPGASALSTKPSESLDLIDTMRHVPGHRTCCSSDPAHFQSTAPKRSGNAGESSSSTSQQEWSSENGVYRCFGDIPLGASHCTKDAMQTSLCGPQGQARLDSYLSLAPFSIKPAHIPDSGLGVSFHLFTFFLQQAVQACAILSMPSYPWMER
ncbi:hypothetical protein MJG53_013758 [Ovis ammon polii x Ovis aries]|uniref:Uncharacterized protein n=1 Tax=Ovis ammon polii x Ovis aries TaxID=2918886 RepID=A0ACB9UJF9_9CETA|nr:hypothetical protein MJG53_013758 [Ovis ammon polii x Ovis aries]